MASSSGSSSYPSTSTPAFVTYEPPTAKLALQSNKRYHVFLSFRGPDVRKTLVDHLFQALSTAGLNVFLDSEKLEKGEIIGESLERAIASSAIRIPIFSKGYADSAWCLKEASVMLRTPGLIIPLFYHVDPTHVRYPLNESSPYKQAFTKHYGQSDRYPVEEVEGWENAIHQICSRSGWSMDLTQGFEARLVKTVVNDLMKTFDRVPLQVAKHPVGLDSVKDLLIPKLNLNSVDEVVKVGIWGIGGIGKTTIAKALYNQLYTKFEAASFVANVRATKQILEQLTKYDGTVYSVDNGISLFKYRLRGIRVLLILDDVDTDQQLNALVGGWLGRGSRVIITTRDKHILRASECIHEMNGLEINKSLQLFCWHAFLRASPIPKYKDLSKQIVEACKGHPLSLEVIGSFLYDKQDNEGCWREALQDITKEPEIQKTLYISYSALNNNEKEIFIDIACFFIGEQPSLPIAFWKSLYTKVESAVTNLSMKLLIKINDKGAFDMHDHLRDIGRSIAEEEKQGTRIWKASHLSTLSHNNNVSRLRLTKSNPQRHEMLYRLGIRYLHLQDMHIEDTQDLFFPNLVWLRMEKCTFAKNKILTKIRNLYRAVRKKIDSNSVGNIKQLKIMQVTENSISSMSPLFSVLCVQQLQHLDLRGCGFLKGPPDSIGSLSQLQHLNLRGCILLEGLPDNIGSLSQLQHLDLGRCERLEGLPDSIGSLSQLQHLNLRGCILLEGLPDNIGSLSQLQHLDLSRCERLEGLPDSIGSLSQLQHLDLSECWNLNELPESIGSLSQLQHLNLRGCILLEGLPDNIGSLSQLQHLDLGRCERLEGLPDSIGSLSQLQHLNLRGCILLEGLPDNIGSLSQLQHLDLSRCERLEGLPDSIGSLSQLQHLDLSECWNLNELPESIGSLSQLQHLNLRGCILLEGLPDNIGSLSQLQHLDLGRCERLEGLPDSIGSLSQLQHLNLRGCILLEGLPDNIGSLSQLQHLDLSRCERLEGLPDSIGSLSQLQHLDLSECWNLNELPESIGSLSQLQHLYLSQCGRLQGLPDSIGSLSQLQHLYLSQCRRLVGLPDSIVCLSQLQHIDLTECWNLKGLPDSIGNLSVPRNVVWLYFT